MKYTTIYNGDNKIEVHNSFLGKETIRVNGELVSSKYSITGTEHEFGMDEATGRSNCKIVTGFGLSGIVLDFYKNGSPVIVSPKNSMLGVLIIACTVLAVTLLLM